MQLVGDKQETAINIGVACNLVLPEKYMKHIIINPSAASDNQQRIDLMLKEISVRKELYSICIFHAAVITRDTAIKTVDHIGSNT
jgi:magnesium-transporting ATPase (P-type)